LEVQLVLGLSAFPLSFLVFPVAIRAATLLVGFHVVITPLRVLLLLLLLLFVLTLLTLTTLRALTLAGLSALVSFITHVEFSFAHRI
jgi:hypothetical protein